MPWRYALLRDARVLARCNDAGDLVADAGRVEVRYRATDSRAYRAGLRNLTVLSAEPLLPDDACVSAEESNQSAGKGAAGGGTRRRSAKDNAAPTTAPKDSIIVYTDGACSGNPGPCGVGVVLMDGETRREYSGYLGHGTNNVAELTAIQVAAEAVNGAVRPVRIHTDSSYSIGVLTKGWKAKANVELIANVKRALSFVQDVGLIHVRGHAGIPENERADQLAVAAVTARQTAGWSR